MKSAYHPKQTPMKFLDYCKLHSLDPFAPESKAAHRKAQSQNRPQTVKGWLRKLRTLDADAVAASNRYAHVRQLDEGLQLKGRNPADLSLLIARAEEAQALFDAHAAKHPALTAEYLLRAQVAELQEQLRAIDLNPPAPKPAPDAAPLALRALQAQQRADALQADADRIVRGIVPLDEEWQAFHANPLNGPGYQRDRLEDRLRRAGTAALRASKSAENAHTQAVKLQARAEKAMRAETDAANAAKRHETDILLAREHQARLRAELAQARAKLPPTEAAPLTEARVRKPATAALGERYIYEPATQSIIKRSTGKPLAPRTNTVMVNGTRYTVAQVAEALGPPAPPAAINPYEFV